MMSDIQSHKFFLDHSKLTMNKIKRHPNSKYKCIVQIQISREDDGEEEEEKKNCIQ